MGDALGDQMFTDVSDGHAFGDAINCVAYYGITNGTGDGSTYSPNDDVTRAEMATFLIGLLVEAAPNVTVDSNGTILLGTAGSRSVADDRFPDTSDAKIAALYELGVTRGASAAEVQDPTMPPLDLNYEPDGTVDRGQMAALLGGFASNSATVTVLDQYGNPFPGAKVRLAGTLSGSGTVTHGTAELTVDGRGSRRFAYQYRGQGGETETLTPSYGATTANLTGTTATVYWAADAGPNDDDEARAVLAGDIRRRHIVVNDGDGPVLLVYDDNDRFNLRGEPTSMAAFEAVLAAALRQDSPGVTLEWSNYRAGSDRRVTEYDLT